MDFHQAINILEIDLNAIKMTDLNKEYIKRQYRKMALINHPDKNENSIESTNKFQKINEAYEYLLNEFVSSNERPTIEINETKEEINGMYMHLLSLFIGSIVDGPNSWNKVTIKNVIKEIVINLKDISLEKIFDELDKDSALEVYSFICKYKHILHIGTDTLDFVSSLIKKKYKNDRVFILNPSIVDLLESNIFKLFVDEQLYLVPLWHNELYFDSPSGDIIVLCNPELPENMTIDEDNNIHVTKEIEGQYLIDLVKGAQGSDTFAQGSNAFAQGSAETAFVSLLIGQRDFSIPLNQLHMKKEQTYKFSKQGIANVIENDIYNVSSKADIIAKIRII